jgi:hypothetical protein
LVQRYDLWFILRRCLNGRNPDRTPWRPSWHPSLYPFDGLNIVTYFEPNISEVVFTQQRIWNFFGSLLVVAHILVTERLQKQLLEVLSLPSFRSYWSSGVRRRFRSRYKKS